MPVVLIGLALVGGYLLFSSQKGSPNPLNPNKAAPGAPGPAPQGLKTTANPGVSVQFSPPNFSVGVGTGSPNSTLATVNNGLVVANNALGMFDQLSNYLGSSNSNAADSEYPVQNSYQSATPDVPVQSPAPSDNASYVGDSSTDSDYTSP